MIILAPEMLHPTWNPVSPVATPPVLKAQDNGLGSD